MNAGAYGKEMKEVVLSSKYLTQDNEEKEILKEEHQFSYRHSIFCENHGIILETVLELPLRNKEIIEQEMQALMKSRKEKQPVEYPSAGSTFKRGEGFITAQLIDECGLRGLRIGDAEVSEKHAGFIINKGKATAKDVLELVEKVERQVQEKFGKTIHLEIEVIRRRVGGRKNERFFRMV